NSNASYARGYLLFLRERTLMAQAFDPKRLETTSDAFPIAEQVQPGRVPVTGIFSVSEDVLVYQSGSGERGSQLMWFDRTNKPISKLGDVGLTIVCVFLLTERVQLYPCRIASGLATSGFMRWRGA